MQIIETTLTETSDGVVAEIMIADRSSADEPDEWLHFRVPVKCETWWALAAIQRLALHRIQDVIAAETQRIERIANQRPD